MQNYTKGEIIFVSIFVLIQRLSDEFELPNGWYMTPAMAGDVLTKCEVQDVKNFQQQPTYKSGTGKLMHMMQYSQPEVYNCVQDQARHMGCAEKKHISKGYAEVYEILCGQAQSWTGTVTGCAVGWRSKDTIHCAQKI